MCPICLDDPTPVKEETRCRHDQNYPCLKMRQVAVKLINWRRDTMCRAPLAFVLLTSSYWQIGSKLRSAPVKMTKETSPSRTPKTIWRIHFKNNSGWSCYYTEKTTHFSSPSFLSLMASYYIHPSVMLLVNRLTSGSMTVEKVGHQEPNRRSIRTSAVDQYDSPQSEFKRQG